VRRHHEWNRALDRTDVVDDGPIGEGTRAVEIRRTFGREMGSPFVITLHQRPERQDFHTTGGPVRPDGIMRCVAEANGTRASYEMTLRGPFGRMFALMIKRGMPTGLANVKRILETAPPT
jgi:hypothetical protein